MDTHADRNADTHADRNVDTHADRPKKYGFLMYHGEDLPFFRFFHKIVFRALRDVKLSFLGGEPEAKKNDVKMKNHPHLSIFGRPKTRGKKGRLAHAITTFKETRIRKKEEEK